MNRKRTAQPTATSNTKRRVPRIIKWTACGAVGTFVALGIIGSFMPDQPEAAPSTPTTAATSQPATVAPSPTAAPAAAKKVAPVKATTAAPTQVPEVTLQQVAAEKFGDRLVSIDKDGDNILITVKLRDEFGLNRLKAQEDTLQALHAVAWKAPGKSATVVGKASMKDAYGNVGDKSVMAVNYSPDTISKINFDSMDAERAWEIADDSPKMIHPDFMK